MQERWDRLRTGLDLILDQRPIGVFKLAFLPRSTFRDEGFTSPSSHKPYRTPVSEGGGPRIAESEIDRGGTSTSRLYVNLDFLDGPSDVTAVSREEIGGTTGRGIATHQYTPGD